MMMYLYTSYITPKIDIPRYILGNEKKGSSVYFPSSSLDEKSKLRKYYIFMYI